MAARVAIELSIAACRILEVDARRDSDAPPWTRVRRFASFPAGSPELAAALTGLKRREASVVVWGVPGDHRQVMVTTGGYDRMLAEATRSLALAGVDTRRALADIARVRGGDWPADRRPVVVALASRTAVAAALRPLHAAGIRVRSISTPATALTSLARLCRRLSPPAGAPGVEAFVAIEERSTCIAIFRDESLVAARELHWGYCEDGRALHPRHPDDVEKRLIDELAEFMVAISGSLEAIDRIVLCGGFPELRLVATQAAERLTIPVDALDTLLGIDENHLPEPADGFRMRAADCRLAWAVATDTPLPLSLLHVRERQRAQARLARYALAAGVAAGLGLGWQALDSPLLRLVERISVFDRVEPTRKPFEYLPEPVVVDEEEDWPVPDSVGPDLSR
jgi:hypothetical protein